MVSPEFLDVPEPSSISGFHKKDVIYVQDKKMWSQSINIP